jgi:phage gpG-like protein
MASPEALLPILRKLEVATLRTSPYIAQRVGDDFQDKVREVLHRSEHPMFTRTPAPAGGPPAFMTGELSYSISVRVSGGASTSRAWVGPKDVIYAGVQEYGAVINVKHTTVTKTGKTIPGFMRWYEDGSFWYKRQVRIPERPYMRIARDEALTDGSMHRWFLDAFLEAQGR